MMHASSLWSWLRVTRSSNGRTSSSTARGGAGKRADAAGIGYVALVLQYAVTAAQQFWMQPLIGFHRLGRKDSTHTHRMPIWIRWSGPAMF